MPWLLVVAVIGLLYPYLLYPLLISSAARLWGKTQAVTPVPSTPIPFVAILVSAYNEEARIRAKIANFETLEYQTDRLELWIGIDGSTDRTAEVVRESANPRVHLVERSQRMGKTAVLNDLAAQVHANVLIFTDVNAEFRPDAVRLLVAALADPKVGLVSGRTVIRGEDGNVEVEGAYYKFESWLKAREGACGWLAGADGAIYALRANLYRELPPVLINDLVHPCHVVAQGFEARLEPLAVSVEHAGQEAGREFDRQTRITAQAAYLLATQMGGLLRRPAWGMVWVLVSHKWMRWIAGLWILAGWVAVTAIQPILGAAAVAALIVLVIAWRFGVRAAGLPVYFLLIHLAYLWGLWRALMGERYVTWRPRAG